MDKGAIKNYAVWARRKLIEDITQKAFEVGVTEGRIDDAVRVSSDAVQVNGRLLNKHEAKQREALVARVKEKGFGPVIEEAAYTWFNRIIAIRFMEVNDYLPTGVRVLSSTEPGKAVPDMITNALYLDLDLELGLVGDYLDEHNDDELFRYLFTRQCNKLNEILPGLFEKIEDYTELLLPNNLLIEGSVIRRLVGDIPADDFEEQVEIIGWLYQYYISEKKDQVFAALKKNVKITKENIPAATQLFTPEWIVKYMVENSLGRLWLEGHPDKELKANWKYYLEEAEQEPEVQKQLDEIKEKSKVIRPEDIKVLDPCMGSGHILVYAFDVLFEIYKSAGYAERDAVRLIIEKNLYGLDIDDRAYQLAYFAVMMKAKKHDRRFLTRGIMPSLCAIQESNGLISFEYGAGQLSLDDLHKETANYLIQVFRDAKEYGSILNIEQRDYDGLLSYIEKLQWNGVDDLLMSMWLNNISQVMPALIKQAKVMAQKYDVVVTNPPYMSISNVTAELNEFARNFYPNSKFDLSSMFMERTLAMCKPIGMMAMINIPVWMSKKSFEQLRFKLLSNHSFINMLHFGRGVFGSDFGTTSFIIRKTQIKNYSAVFRQLYEKLGNVDSLRQKEEWFFSNKGYYVAQQSKFLSIASYPIPYWVSATKLDILDQCKPLSYYAAPRKGLTTGDNDRFARLWFEINCKQFSIFSNSPKWFPMTKGGEFRRWYGNNKYVVNWENNGAEICNFRGEDGKLRSRPQNTQYYFRECISWNDTTATGKIAFRYQTNKYIPNASGPCVYFDKDLPYFFGLLNSCVSQCMLEILAPNMKFEVGQMALVPIVKKLRDDIEPLVSETIEAAKEDWDSFECSWDFSKHPLLLLQSQSNLLKDIYETWVQLTAKRFDKLKKNEVALNRIYIGIYGLQDELTPGVEDKDVTIRKADLGRDVRSFISYAIGCMFGRYSLDVNGLIYAGGEWDESKYQSFIPDHDNVLPILDDEYFDDDIVSRFIQFLQVTFGEETLEGNLDFIAGALGLKASETSRQAIRRYFLKDFYKDHVKIYQKRPIYWLFDSGKEDGFKALIYMHRYDEFTVARVRTDYLHRLQRAYEAEARRLEILIDSDVSQREKTAARKKREKLLKQMQECLAYDQVIAHVANQRIKIDLDDGVKVNYAKFQGVEVPQGEGKKPLKANLLAKI